MASQAQIPEARTVDPVARAVEGRRVAAGFWSQAQIPEARTVDRDARAVEGRRVAAGF